MVRDRPADHPTVTDDQARTMWPRVPRRPAASQPAAVYASVLPSPRLLHHRQSVSDRDNQRLEARGEAAVLGQKLAPPGETRLSVLAEIRMPILVADAWHALAVIGPPARAKLGNALKGRAVVEDASRRDLSWRPKSMGGPPADPFAEITQIRRVAASQLLVFHLGVR
jgi:hypothetical protein